MLECMKNMAKPHNDTRWIPVKYHVMTEEERKAGGFSNDNDYPVWSERSSHDD